MLSDESSSASGSQCGSAILCAACARVDEGDAAWVLLLDPAAHKLGPHWLPQEILAATMCTVNSRGEARGYLAISHGDEHDADHGDLHQGAWHQAAPPAAQPHDRF